MTVSHPDGAHELADLRREVAAGVSVEDFRLRVENAALGRTYVGTITGSGTLRNIERVRVFYRPSAYYGHRHGPNVAAVASYRSEGQEDLFCTDSGGVMAPSLSALESAERIMYARQNKLPVIAFFGGSTMEGSGSRLPEWTIPSLVERHLSAAHRIESVCINYGVGLWMSSESLGLLTHEVLGLQPDAVIFYDGWACCSYLAACAKAELLRARGADVPISYKGAQLRHLEADATLSGQYQASTLMRRALNIVGNALVSFPATLLQSARARKALESIAARFFPIRLTSRLHAHLVRHRLSEDEIEVMTKANVSEYLRLHELARELCELRGIRFLHILQPIVSDGRKPLTPTERRFKEEGYGSGDARIHESFYDEVRLRGLGPKLRDYGDVFDRVSDEVFVDSGHLNPLGNFLVAERMSADVAELLQSTR